MALAWLLVIVHHPDPSRIGRRIRLGVGDGILLGRGCSAFGVDGLIDARISRRHCRVLVKGDELRLEDTGSRNGTMVDGHPIRRIRVNEGSVIGMGGVLLQGWKAALDEAPSMPPTVGESPAMSQVRAALLARGAEDGPVLFVGEGGTGRTTAARALHNRVAPTGPLVQLSTAALPDEAAPSALHGHASDRRPQGALARAEGGMLLLPHIDAAPRAVQVELARFLDDGLLRPVDDAPRPLRLQLVCTASRAPELCARDGLLLPELARRFAGATLSLPPLRERRMDILPLARLFAGRQSGRQVALDRLLALLLALHEWPGNAVELEQVMARVVREQPDEEVLKTPPWGPDAFGPRAQQVFSTFDPSRVDPSQGDPSQGDPSQGYRSGLGR